MSGKYKCPGCGNTLPKLGINCTICGNYVPDPYEISFDEIIDSGRFLHLKEFGALVICLIILLCLLLM